MIHSSYDLMAGAKWVEIERSGRASLQERTVMQNELKLSFTLNWQKSA